jgi:hypothetical protein
MKKIKTIDVEGKEWFDRTCGNSYFAARVTVDYGLKTERVLVVPMQYGYGQQYEHEAFRTLVRAGLVPITDAADAGLMLSMYCRDRGIVLRSRLAERCLKRDVKRWGEED